jgi:hypothetical protein
LYVPLAPLKPFVALPLTPEAFEVSLIRLPFSTT